MHGGSLPYMHSLGEGARPGVAPSPHLLYVCRLDNYGILSEKTFLALSNLQWK